MEHFHYRNIGQIGHFFMNFHYARYKKVKKSVPPNIKNEVSDHLKGSFSIWVGIKPCFPGLWCRISMQSWSPMMKKCFCSRKNAPGLFDASFTSWFGVTSGLVLPYFVHVALDSWPIPNIVCLGVKTPLVWFHGCTVLRGLLLAERMLNGLLIVWALPPFVAKHVGEGWWWSMEIVYLQ